MREPSLRGSQQLYYTTENISPGGFLSGHQHSAGVCASLELWVGASYISQNGRGLTRFSVGGIAYYGEVSYHVGGLTDHGGGLTYHDGGFVYPDPQKNLRHPSWGISSQSRAKPQAYRKTIKCFNQAISKGAFESVRCRTIWLLFGGYHFRNVSIV